MIQATTPPYYIFQLPTGEKAWMPADIELRVPAKSSIPANLLHFLVSIPWDDRYLELVDPDYRDFFQTVLPYLHFRTTDVHVATCLPFVKELLLAEREPVDEQVIYLAFILHDVGWSQMTEKEIAASLGVEGLALSGSAVSPKARHVVLGEELAQHILRKYPFQKPLTTRQMDMICQAILYHDKPQELETMGKIPAEVKIVCDVDHLWSFTHPNFWQDTIRKEQEPEIYHKHLAADLDDYFVGEAGRRKARRMLEDRMVEIKTLEEWIAQH